MQIKLIKNSERVGTDYIEFVVSQEETVPKNWQDDAYFLPSGIYVSFFWDCFVNSGGQKFDFVGPPTMYKDEELNKIAILLDRNREIFESIVSKDEFVSFANKHGEFTMDLDYYGMDWSNNWSSIIVQLTEINCLLLKMVQCCLKTSKVLWVLGV